MKKRIKFWCTYVVGAHGTCIFDLQEIDSEGKRTYVILDDVIVGGYEDWVDALPIQEPVYEGVYLMEGEAWASEDDLAYSNVQIESHYKPEKTVEVGHEKEKQV